VIQIAGFPKDARLLKKRDFSFRPFKRQNTEYFKFIYSENGSGRIGVSISKKVLRRAVARNRVRRLLRESFRLRRANLLHRDIHVIGLPTLSGKWDQFALSDICREWDLFENVTTNQ
jgi:ribonuclease P protein component